MLSEKKLKTLKTEINRYSREELVWFNGYLTGILENSQVVTGVHEVLEVTKIQPTILYGTETGNAKKLALQLLLLLKKNKIQAKVVDMAQYAVDKIEKEEFLIGIISTQGEGEPPLSTVGFFEKLEDSILRLNKTRYAVLALGDSSYPLFCRAGEDLDALWSKLGAERVLPLQKTDVEYQEAVDVWSMQLLQVLQNTVQKKELLPEVNKEKAVFTAKMEHEGTISHKVILNDRGSNKETHHIEITYEGKEIYQPGDAIGFYPKNKEEETRAVAALLKAEERHKELEDINIKGLSLKTIRSFAQLLNKPIEEEVLDLEDLLEKYDTPEGSAFDAVTALLRPIAPRLYSIASAEAAHEGTIHITVGVNRFTAAGKEKKGLCSDFLARLETNDKIPFYIHKKEDFRLPEEPTDIILIGPGTGIAPFRSFLAHRDAVGASGRNWLFFGELHFVSDFYYQTEIQQWLETGLLTRLETAFSRDQKHKVYVQDRIRENAEEFMDWMDKGAHLYICGQKHPMGTDVENTLLELISNAKKMNGEQAKAYLEKLEGEGRYKKDVY